MNPRATSTAWALLWFTVVRVVLVAGFTAAAYATGWWPLHLCLLIGFLAAFAVSFAFLYRWQGLVSRALLGAVQSKGLAGAPRRWWARKRALFAERTAHEDAAADEFHRRQTARLGSGPPDIDEE